MIIIKIAFRNIVQNRWRSLLICFALFICTFVLLVSNAAMNGIEAQVISGYVNYQSGHVAVLWSGMKEVSYTDPSRFLQNLVSYDPGKEAENLNAISRLDQYLAEHQTKVAAGFPGILRLGRYTVGDINDQIVLYGLTEEHSRYLQDAKSLALVEGALPQQGEYGISISEFLSDELEVGSGGTLSLRVLTPGGEVREQEFMITGIYANGAGYDNFFAFMTDEDARALTGVNEPYFDLFRIYLNDSGDATTYAGHLDSYLLVGNSVLRAESYLEASPFFTNNSRSMRLMFNIFVAFILAVMAFGLLSTIRMNLFARMQEFGTLRAIGFSRSQNFGIIFTELFLLSVAALGAALLSAGIVVTIFGHTGIYVGTGVLSYGVGGERFWPWLRAQDVFLALTAITLFSLFATLSPGLSLCYQAITDLMNKRSRRLFLPARIIREWLSRST